ncbi:acyl CoA binding protein-domain-containing protein [Mycena pura]|uniref:Acyl CoA binding protein-domain-containing protein n=1 Tax=Mycena pura TaxID=153505 RepID=A0AAD6V7W9_9AGAR|nr:acyl CoA binding protein-domain-containing protein [Mycena pura]
MAKGKFEAAVEIAKNLSQRASLRRSGDDELYLYSYYMQATAGDNTTPRPGVSLKTKWDAWSSVKGTPKAKACTMYVEKVVAILTAAGDPESKRHLAQIEAAK